MVKEERLLVDDVDWEDSALRRWLDTITRNSTKYGYRTAFRAYHLFTGKSASELIDEALEDAKRDPRERRDVVLKRLVEFYNWMKTEYPQKSRGRGPKRIVGKGSTDKQANVMVNSVRSFYATFGVTVRMKGRHALPRPRVSNKRMKIAADQAKILVDHARTPRDRAIILTLFQGGMDVSTLCSLRYGDISEALKKDEQPLKLELFRRKSGTEYYTFLGKDSVEAIRVYLADMKSRGRRFKHDTPLFVKERGTAGLTTNLVQNMMRTVALKSGLIDEENNGKAFNPLGPHALRESFGSIMINSGVPDTIVDFWLGHTIGEMAEAYKGVQFESLKSIYLEREKLISISTSKVDVKEIEEKLRNELEGNKKELQALVNGLATKSLRLEEENKDLKQRISVTEEKLADLEKIIREVVENPSKSGA
jgi:site-specific recombinase XerD